MVVHSPPSLPLNATEGYSWRKHDDSQPLQQIIFNLTGEDDNNKDILVQVVFVINTLCIMIVTKVYVVQWSSIHALLNLQHSNKISNVCHILHYSILPTQVVYSSSESRT